MKEVKFDLSHFSVQNTPVLAQKIGNYCLIAAGIGTTILAIPDTMAAQGLVFVLPNFLVVTAKALVGVGILIKMVTKCFGTIETTANGTSEPK